MKWEVTIRKAKEDEMNNYASPLYALLQQLRKNLRRQYRGQKNKVNWFMSFSPLRKTFGFQNIPEKAIPTLELKLRDYAGRRVIRRRHQHTWKLALNCKGILWLVCGDEQCGAEDPILLTDSMQIAQKIILPLYRNLGKMRLYETPNERKLINRFLAIHKERAVREATKDMDKELLIFKQLRGDPPEKVNTRRIRWLIRKLERDKQDLQTAMVVL